MILFGGGQQHDTRVGGFSGRFVQHGVCLCGVVIRGSRNLGAVNSVGGGLRFFGNRINGLGQHIMVAIAVLRDHPGLLHQGAQSVIEIGAAFGVGVDALDHLIGLVVGVRPNAGDLLVFAVLLLDQVAPLVIGEGSVGLPTVAGLLRDLIQIIELVVRGDVIGVGLPGEVAQAVILIGAAGISIVFLGIGHPVQRIIGIEVLYRGLAGAIAPHILIGHVAAVIIFVDMLLLLHVLAAGIGVFHLQQLADGIVVVVLHPAVRILHLHRAAHTVVSVGGGTAIVLGDSFELAQQVIGLGGCSAVGIGNAGLVAGGVVGVGNDFALGVRSLGDPVEQIHLEGRGARPVGHLHQIAHLIVLIGYLLAIIIVDGGHHIKAIIAIGGHISVGICLGLEIAVAIVSIGGHIAQSIHLFGGKAAAIILVQGDLPLVHTVLSIHTMQRGLDQVTHQIILKESGVAQGIDGLDHVAVGIQNIAGLMAALICAGNHLAFAIVFDGLTLAIRRSGLDEPVQRIVFVGGHAVHSGLFDHVVVTVVLIGDGVAFSVGLGGHIAAIGVGVGGHAASGIGDGEHAVHLIIGIGGGVAQSVGHLHYTSAVIVIIVSLRTFLVDNFDQPAIGIIGLGGNAALGILLAHQPVQTVVGVIGGVAVSVGLGGFVAVTIIGETVGVALSVHIRGQLIAGIVGIGDAVAIGLSQLYNVAVGVILSGRYSANGIGHGQHTSQTIIGIGSGGPICVGLRDQVSICIVDYDGDAIHGINGLDQIAHPIIFIAGCVPTCVLDGSHAIVGIVGVGDHIALFIRNGKIVAVRIIGIRHLGAVLVGHTNQLAGSIVEEGNYMAHGVCGAGDTIHVVVHIAGGQPHRRRFRELIPVFVIGVLCHIAQRVRGRDHIAISVIGILPHVPVPVGLLDQLPQRIVRAAGSIVQWIGILSLVPLVVIFEGLPVSIGVRRSDQTIQRVILIPHDAAFCVGSC